MNLTLTGHRPRGTAWLRSPALGLGSALLILVGIGSVVAPLLTPYRPTDQRILDRLQPPSPAHWLGTDQYGRDVLTRMLFGGRTSLLLGLGAVVLALACGVPIGLAAGYRGGFADNLLMRMTDVFLSFPSLLLALLVITGLGASLVHAIVAVGMANASGIARLVRGATLAVRNEEFVLAARARRESGLYTAFGEIFPNILAPVIVEATIRIGFAILTGASLSFLGLGVQPPQADWGVMIRESREYIFLSPWPLIVPGAALGLTIIGFNLFGDGLGDTLGRRR
jgi:peptide/nickel transport system permease protein